MWLFSGFRSSSGRAADDSSGLVELDTQIEVFSLDHLHWESSAGVETASEADSQACRAAQGCVSCHRRGPKNVDTRRPSPAGRSRVPHASLALCTAPLPPHPRARLICSVGSYPSTPTPTQTPSQRLAL
jgi:hypothetical protein